jgi:hypothetical protein
MWGFSFENGGYLQAPFGVVAILDNNHSYTTPGQFAQATVAEIWRGTSTIVQLCNDTMTNFAGAQIYKTTDLTQIIGLPTDQDRLRIVTGTAYNAMTIQFEYAVPSPGIKSGDQVAIAYDPSNSTFYLLWNGNEIGSWPDTTHIVNQANRRQGFIMNSDDNVFDLQFGVSLNNMIGYDATFTTLGLPGTPGDLSSRVFLFWREAWHVE